MPKYPEISYSHTLSELSVNRQDPCEVIRELISNAYDADATKINIYPLLQYEGFIFFDNGIGLNDSEKINGITPYIAFFSIGQSTKTKGSSIGYKCQGSKLCFASSKFHLITRCQGESHWRSKSIDNPTSTLKLDYDIEAQKDEQPWQTLSNLFTQADKHTKPILDSLNSSFFQKDFTQGTMIIVLNLQVENFSDYYGNDVISYFKNYIRFNTRHGDMRILRYKETGFTALQDRNFRSTPGYNDQCELNLWTKNTLEIIKVGYPYLDKPSNLDEVLIKSPLSISLLKNGNFYGRSAKTFDFGDRTYCLTLAIDGNRRALDQYKELDRKGPSGKKSGIRLTDQRGTFICAQGVKICPYNQIFEQEILKNYEILSSGDAQRHYIFMINGEFDLVTNRNSVSEPGLKVLKSSSFLKEIKEFLDDCFNNNEVFKELINRLTNDNQENKLNAYIEQINDLKAGIRHRTRFQVNNIEQLKGKWFVEPIRGEEHWVGALYTLFSHLVPSNSPYSKYWLRPRNFSSIGIDSLAVILTENSLNADVHQGLEYKFSFSSKDDYNHPLIVTSQIVCWEIPEGDDQDKIKDEYYYFGQVHINEEIKDIGYEIINIQGPSGDVNHSVVKVISLKELIKKTFDCDWTTPPPREKSNGQSKKRGRKRK